MVVSVLAVAPNGHKLPPIQTLEICQVVLYYISGHSVLSEGSHRKNSVCMSGSAH